jgi:hypothetical protein
MQTATKCCAVLRVAEGSTREEYCFDELRLRSNLVTHTTSPDLLIRRVSSPRPAPPWAPRRRDGARKERRRGGTPVGVRHRWATHESREDGLNNHVVDLSWATFYQHALHAHHLHFR